MTNDEAYDKLLARGVSGSGALWVLTYAYRAQLVGGWNKLVVSSGGDAFTGGSEGAKYRAMQIFKDAGIDPMAISFPERLIGTPPFGRN